MEEKKTCQRCKREIDPESEEVLQTGDGRMFCGMRCIGGRQFNFNAPEPHFE